MDNGKSQSVESEFRILLACRITPFNLINSNFITFWYLPNSYVMKSKSRDKRKE